MYEWMAWLTLGLIAHWFFGNLYEAIVLIPNIMALLALKMRTGEPLFTTKRASPVAYYIPLGPIMFVLALFLAVISLVQHRPDSFYILTICALLLAAGGLTVYVVRFINIDLFFTPHTELARARGLLKQWSLLNYLRVALAGAALVIGVFWMRIIITS